MPNLNSAVEAVLSYHQVLVNYDGALITEWEFEAEGDLHLPYPTYPEPIETFISSVTNLVQRWIPTIGDYQDASRKYVADHSAIKDASPDDIKAILTYIWRGERFCDGLWAEVISSGLVAATMDRLQELYQSGEVVDS